ncbi:MAG: hypothetical protein EOL98_07930 [Negativicutes bacterium]|nr:hypothetical protein [Negativicutes bacterium]
MSITVFKDVCDKNIARFADSSLGKFSELNSSIRPLNEYDKPLGIICDNIRNCPIEANNGHWDGDRGNSTWKPDRDYAPGKSNPEGKNWGQILDKYGIDGIKYKEGEPDFSKISKGTSEIEPFSDNRSDNFDKADIELAKQKGQSPEDVAKWRKENGYTWHECKDMKTMQKVPSEIHNNISHSGGISEAKKGNGGS